MIKDLSRTAFS